MLENLKRQEAVLPTLDRRQTLEMLLELQTLYFGDDEAIKKYGDAAYWNALASGKLTCCGSSLSNQEIEQKGNVKKSSPSLNDNPNGNKELLENISTQGYHVLPPTDGNQPPSAFTDTIKALADAGWPPQFLLMYDETWELVKKAARQIVGGDDSNTNATIESDVNIWALKKHNPPGLYYIGGNFIHPHRDMIFSACHDDDENATSLSVWIPLNPSGATERNGCMRVLPIESDDFFYSPLHPRHSMNSQYTDNDAEMLRVEQFGTAVWDPCCVHWGGSYEADAGCDEEPRSSLAFTIRLGTKKADFGTTPSVSRISGDAGSHTSPKEVGETGPAACLAMHCDRGGPKRRLQVVAKSLLSYSHHWPGFPFPGFRENLNQKEKFTFMEADDSKEEVAKCTDNMLSLLKEASEDDAGEQGEGIVMTDGLAEVAQIKVLQELRSLYEEYTFATAKDASLTDDVRFENDSHHTEDSLVYGEIDLEGFCDLLLNDIPHTSQDIFYDLGSGSGRAVMAARFVGDFQECIGIELLGNLHDLASSVKSLYKFQYQHKLIHRNVQFICSDLLDCQWWTNGTIIYVPNLLYDENLKAQIAEKATKLRPGAYLICLKTFQSPEFNNVFELVKERLVAMSWGESNVYIYQRQKNHEF